MAEDLAVGQHIAAQPIGAMSTGGGFTSSIEAGSVRLGLRRNEDATVNGMGGVTHLGQPGRQFDGALIRTRPMVLGTRTMSNYTRQYPTQLQQQYAIRLQQGYTPRLRPECTRYREVTPLANGTLC